MRFSTIAVFFLFACIAYASNAFARAHNKELSPRDGSRRKFLTIKKRWGKSSKPVDPSTAIATFMDSVLLHNPDKCLIAESNAFKVYKPKVTSYRYQNGKNLETAVIKVIQGTGADSVKEEMEEWAKTGYLLAYATRNSATYLILKVKAPDLDRLSPELQEHYKTVMREALMREALMRKALNSAPTDVRLAEFPENFVWTSDKPTRVRKIVATALRLATCTTCFYNGNLEVKVFDWKGGNQAIGPARPLTEIPVKEYDVVKNE